MATIRGRVAAALAARRPPPARSSSGPRSAAPAVARSTRLVMPRPMASSSSSSSGASWRGVSPPRCSAFQKRFPGRAKWWPTAADHSPGLMPQNSTRRPGPSTSGTNRPSAAVLVGDDEASHIYVGSKQRAAERSGIGSRLIELPATASQEEVLPAVAELNADDEVNGILVQLPLPAGLDPVEVQDAIDPAKDVDGLHPENEGRLLRGDPRFAPCTAIGIVELLRREKVPVEGSHVVIVGRGLLVGRPLAVLLSAKAPGANATVTLCHTGTRGL